MVCKSGWIFAWNQQAGSGGRKALLLPFSGEEMRNGVTWAGPWGNFWELVTSLRETRLLVWVEYLEG